MSLEKRRKDGPDIKEMIRTWRLQQRAPGLRAKGMLSSAKGIGVRCKGHLASYIWNGICTCFGFRQGVPLLRDDGASGEEVEN